MSSLFMFICSRRVWGKIRKRQRVENFIIAFRVALRDAHDDYRLFSMTLPEGGERFNVWLRVKHFAAFAPLKDYRTFVTCTVGVRYVCIDPLGCCPLTAKRLQMRLQKMPRRRIQFTFRKRHAALKQALPVNKKRHLKLRNLNFTCKNNIIKHAYWSLGDGDREGINKS